MFKIGSQVYVNAGLSLQGNLLALQGSSQTILEKFQPCAKKVLIDWSRLGWYYN